MSGTNCYILQQNGTILRELKAKKIPKTKTCTLVELVVVAVTVTVAFVIAIAVLIVVEISSSLILSYEIRFMGLFQEITNYFVSIQP